VFYPAKKLYRPEFFQGDRRLGKAARYFEGWYFKAAFEDSAVAVIPGISLAPNDPHGFIQLFGASSQASRYHRFELEAFDFDRRLFEIRLGANRFSLTRVDVEVDDFRAHLSIEGAVRWPSALFSPSSMGWYSFMRFMECYHGIIVLDATVRGTVNGESRAGRFYLEKDWGVSFPKAWIWMQSNSFAAPASLTCSVARVPFRGREFTGFIIGLLARGKLYPFTTYNGSQLTGIEYSRDSVHITARRCRTVVHITARRRPGVQLASPVHGRMRGRIEETLSSEISVVLERDGREIFRDGGVYAGLEVIEPQLLRRGISRPSGR